MLKDLYSGICKACVAVYKGFEYYVVSLKISTLITLFCIIFLKDTGVLMIALFLWMNIPSKASFLTFTNISMEHTVKFLNIS